MSKMSPYKPASAPGLNLIELQTVGSTNDYAKQLAKNAYPAGTVVWAHEQTAGRGRQGNTWESYAGNLFMSMILRPNASMAQMGQLSFLVAVAVAKVLEKVVSEQYQIRLKWPNDIFLNGKKLGGILIETETMGVRSVPWAVVGIGINVVKAPEGAACLSDAKVQKTEAGHLLEAIVKEINFMLKHWEEKGFDQIREAWLKKAWKLDQEISVRLPKEEIKGVFLGLDTQGSLRLKMQDGNERLINSGEVFF